MLLFVVVVAAAVNSFARLFVLNSFNVILKRTLQKSTTIKNNTLNVCSHWFMVMLKNHLMKTERQREMEKES